MSIFTYRKGVTMRVSVATKKFMEYQGLNSGKNTVKNRRMINCFSKRKNPPEGGNMRRPGALDQRS